MYFNGQKYFPDTNKMVENNDLDIFYRTKNWLNKYFKGNQPDIKELQLKPDGNEFRMQVWSLLCDIPYGQVTTYGCIAKKIALKRKIKNMSAQAVGNAVGHNPISIIIPCHRVIGKNGNLTGYAAGVETKIKLLELEGADINGVYISNLN